MGRPVNALKVIDETKGKINSDYDACFENIFNIKNISNNYFDMICNAFVFGYAQGVKAQKKGRAYNAKNTINQQ